MTKLTRQARTTSTRGMTLLEVAIATGLILVVASVLTAAVARTVLADANAQLTSQAAGGLEAALAEVGQQVADELNDVAERGLEQALTDGTITVPDPCSQDDTRTCLRIGSTTSQVTYAFTARTRTLGERRQVVTGELTGVAMLPGGGSVLRSTTLYDATAGLLADAGTGAVRVQLTGTDSYTGGVHLLTGSGDGYESVAAGGVGSDGTALIAAQAGECSAADPCRLGLAPDAPWHSDGSWSLTPASVAGDAGEVVLTAGEVIDLTAPVVRTGRAQIDLEAARGTDTDGQPRSSVNLAPPFNEWDLVPGSGQAWVDPDGTLQLRDGGEARVRIRIDEAAGWTFTVDAYADEPGPRAGGADPEDTSRRHMNALYYAEDGTTRVANSAGHSNNGNAVQIDLDTWTQTRFNLFNSGGGEGIVWVELRILSSGAWAGPSLSARDPMFVTPDTAPAATTPYEPFYLTDRSTTRPVVAGSVCLWASFTDPTGPVAVPACNDRSAGALTFDRYAPDPDRPEATVALPVDTPLTITADHPAGTCPHVPGRVTPSTDGWTDEVASCTSWTWGLPDRFTTLGSGSVAFDDATVTLPENSLARYRARWSGDAAVPAAGFDAHPQWLKPRVTGGCGADASCLAVDARHTPETDGTCGSEEPYCLSPTNLGPVVTEPSVGDAGVHTTEVDDGASEHTFPVEVTDLEGDEFTLHARLHPTPSGGGSGTLVRTTSDGVETPTTVPTSTDQMVELGTFDRETVQQFTYRDFDHPEQWLRRLVLVATDVRGESSETVVGIHRGRLPWLLTPQTTTVPSFEQGTTGNAVRWTTIATDGRVHPITDSTVVQVDADSDSRIRLAPAHSLASRALRAHTRVGAARTAEVRVALDGSSSPGIPQVGTERLRAWIRGPGPAVSHPGTWGGNGQMSQIDIDVAPAAGSITLDGAATVNQGRDGQVTATATDLAGDPLRDVAVNLTLTRDGSTSRDVVLDRYRCVTDDTGQCTATVTAAAVAAPGVYQVTARSGSADAAVHELTVDASVAALAATVRPVQQGDTGVLTVRAFSAASQPVDGVEVTAAADGATFNAATTDRDGRANLTVTADDGASLDGLDVTVEVDGVTRRLRIPVTAAPGEVTVVSPPAGIVQHTSGLASVEVLSAAGEPLPGVRLTVEVDGGAVTAPRAVWTDSSGTAAIPLEGRQPGTATVTARTSNDRTVTFTATVTSGG